MEPCTKVAAIKMKPCTESLNYPIRETMQQKLVILRSIGSRNISRNFRIFNITERVTAKNMYLHLKVTKLRLMLRAL